MRILFLVFQATPKSYLDEPVFQSAHLVDIRLVWSIQPSAKPKFSGTWSWHVSST